MNAGTAEFHYKARFPARSFVPGAHASRVRGGGLEVAALVPLWQARDPRRLDLRASLRDPFGGWWVREFNQRASIRVIALVDVSASMAAHTGPQAAAAGFVRALSASAMRIGDAFGLLAFASAPVPSLALRSTRVRPAAAAAVSALAEHRPAGESAGGLLALCDELPREPALVFLVSDFHFPVPALDEALAAMGRHDVVPVRLRSAEAVALPAGFGLLELRDAETGRWRTVWMRRRMRQRWIAQQQAHDEALAACFARHGREALTIAGGFDPDAATDYFAARA